jgi:hypothetical protein
MTSFENFRHYPLEFDGGVDIPELVDRGSLTVEFLPTLAPVNHS